MKKSLLLAAIIALSIALPAVFAQYPPVDFHQFYGTVGGAGAGSIISAQIGTNTFTTVVDSSSRYGYSPLFFVQGAVDGTTITFAINGQQVSTRAFLRGSITELNLALTPPSPQPPSGGGGGGGGGSGGSRRATSWYRNLTQPASPPGAGIECFDDWLCMPWSTCETGLQKRICNLNDYPNCPAALPKPKEEQACEMPPAPAANCFDGIKNQDETYADCGGMICKQCDPSISCLIDNDCVTGYCNPVTTICDWKPVIEVPITPPAAKQSYWWVWLVVFAAILAAVGIGISMYYLERGMKHALPGETPERVAEVKKYAQTFLKKGVPKERIAAKLKEAGWKQEDVDDALK